MNIINEELSLQGLKTIKVEVGKLATQTDASVEVRCGNTVLLVTVVCDKENERNCDFLPLHVDYQEKFFSVGKIPVGGKREGKLNDHEVLISRLIDRSIRPSFEKGYNTETQITVTLLSADGEVIPESLACFGSSLALLLSPAAFKNPVSEVFLYLINDEWIVNPGYKDIKFSTAKMVVGGDEESLIMLEGTFQELTEEKIIEGINIAQRVIKEQCIFQKNFLKNFENIEKIEVKSVSDVNDDKLENNIFDIYSEFIKSKKNRDEKIKALFLDYKKDNPDLSENVFKILRKNAFRKLLFENKKRIDGRNFNEIRNISCEVDYLPSVHGSALFTRGETQALATVTLGDKKDEASKEGVLESGVNKLFLHYNFPSYSVGEMGGLRSPGRREIGHGNLALNGLKAVIPTEGIDSMYTIRIVSDILSSNGSSSMATVCASSLALMDAGIHIKKQVSGIAMGLLLDPVNKDFIILSDINGDEDELGDMDFKVVGTNDGVTALQLDVKTFGLNLDILKTALEQAKVGRLHILEKMNSAIAIPREHTKDFAPCFDVFQVQKAAIGQIIGVGGCNIQNIMRETNSFIYIEEKNNIGTVNIYSKNRESLKACREKVNNFITVPTPGDVYEGTVKTVQQYLAYIEFLPGKIGILKVNDLDWCHVDDMQTVLHVGDIIDVKLMERQGINKFVLSHKVLLRNTAENYGKEKENVQSRIPDNI